MEKQREKKDPMSKILLERINASSVIPHLSRRNYKRIYLDLPVLFHD